MTTSPTTKAHSYSTTLAQVGLLLWAVFALGAPLIQVVPHVVDAPVVVVVILVALLPFVAPVAVTFFFPTDSDKWGVRQRIMLWQAASAAAFLAIDWEEFSDLPRLGEVAMFWVIGGAMGVLLEPVRSLRGSKSTRTR